MSYNKIGDKVTLEEDLRQAKSSLSGKTISFATNAAGVFASLVTGVYTHGLSLQTQSDIMYYAAASGPDFVSSALFTSLYLKESKILLHGSTGGMRDYLEYAILDGMTYGCVPVCITPDSKQFTEIEQNSLGKVVQTEKQLAQAMTHVLNNYHSYRQNIQQFMQKYLNEQPNLMSRWTNTLRKLIKHKNWNKS